MPTLPPSVQAIVQRFTKKNNAQIASASAIAPYRHWALLLGIAGVLVASALAVGAYVFLMVSTDYEPMPPSLTNPEDLLSQEDLAAVLRAVEEKQRAFNTFLATIEDQEVEVIVEDEEGEGGAEEETVETMTPPEAPSVDLID